jgi:hypothetical protein
MKPYNYPDLIEQMGQGGCAICALVERDTTRYLDSLMYEYVNTPETHAKMRAARGFCAPHSAQLVAFGAQVLGIAILQAAVLDELLQRAAQPLKTNGLVAWFNQGNGQVLAERLDPALACPACQNLQKAESLHLRTLVDYVTEPELWNAYTHSSGLCLPHMIAALRLAPDITAELLLRVQRERWEALKAELDLLAQKYDINQAGQEIGAEGDSWRRSLELLAGQPTVFGLRR